MKKAALLWRNRKSNMAIPWSAVVPIAAEAEYAG